MSCAPWLIKHLATDACACRIASAKGVPICLLVVQGGPGTLKMLLDSARLGSSILILSESGGAATAVYQYVCCGGERAELEPKFESKKSVLAEIAKMHEAAVDVGERGAEAGQRASMSSGNSATHATEAAPSRGWRREQSAEGQDGDGQVGGGATRVG